MKNKPKYFIPNIITLANMFLGFLGASSLIMAHLSRLSEEVILWA